MSAFGKKRCKNGKKPGPPVHDDHVRRDFTAAAPNPLWLGDITEHKTAEGQLYVCAFETVYSDRIVGYSIDSRMKSRVAVPALDNAVARRRAGGGVVAGCVVPTELEAATGGNGVAGLEVLGLPLVAVIAGLGAGHEVAVGQRGVQVVAPMVTQLR